MYQIILWLGAATFVCFIGFCRIYLAMHSYNQVIVGVATGFFVWALDANFAKWLDERYLQVIVNKPENWRKEGKLFTWLVYTLLILGVLDIFICKVLVKMIFKMSGCDLVGFDERYPDKNIRF